MRLVLLSLAALLPAALTLALGLMLPGLRFMAGRGFSLYRLLHRRGHGNLRLGLDRGLHRRGRYRRSGNRSRRGRGGPLELTLLLRLAILLLRPRLRDRDITLRDLMIDGEKVVGQDTGLGHRLRLRRGTLDWRLK